MPRLASRWVALAAAAVVSVLTTGAYLAWSSLRSEPTSTPAMTTPAAAKPCSMTVATPDEAQRRLLAAPPGRIVCLAAGSHAGLDLREIDKPDYVTLRGAPGLATTVDGILVGGSSYLRIEGFKSTGCFCFREQWATHHVQFVGNEIGPLNDYAVAGAGAWEKDDTYGPVRDLLFERNHIHDVGGDHGYGIAIAGDGAGVTVRYNRFERIREDYLQSGNPDHWTVDHNWFGPGDFNRPSGYPGHPDVWQTLASGTALTFTNNVVRDTNESLGFIFGAISDLGSFRDLRVVNNLFVRPVYGVGETCQFSPSNGFVFEQNTLVDAQGCRWGSGEGQDWPDARNYSIERNVLVGDSRLTCNDTSMSNSCTAFEAGASGNTIGWSGWRDTRWYWPVGLPSDVGARLGPGDFNGFPFGPARRSGS